MVTSKNSFIDRSVKSGHTPSNDHIILEVIKETVVNGVVFAQSTTVKVSRAEAKKLLATKAFKIVLE